MILNFHGKQKAIRAYAENNKLQVVHTSEDQPRTDGKTLWVPAPSPDWSPDEMLLWEYKVYHEMGHCVPMMNDVFDVMESEKINMRSFLGYVWNLLDDHRQEYHDHDAYEGIRKIMSRGRGLFLDGQVRGCAGGVPATDEAAACKALFAWDSYMRCDFQPECAGAAMSLRGGR